MFVGVVIRGCQWRNSRWGEIECLPDVFHRNIFADLPGKEWRGKKGKWRKKDKNCKTEGRKLKTDGGTKKYENGQRNLSVSFFVLFLFCFVCLFVLGLPKWKFSTGKKHFTPTGKNQE